MNIVILLGIIITIATGWPVAVQMMKNHPPGLRILFFAEMWERFSYYGMRALLIFYLTKHWLFDDGKSNLIYGAYTSLVYITPVLGGYLADRYLGQRKAVGKVVVKVNPEFYRPYDPAQPLADIRKAQRLLGWQPQQSLHGLVSEMVEFELQQLKA